MATVTRRDGPATLKGVPYATYLQLRNAPGNQGLRMTYFDGTLEIMSPEYRHENPTRKFDLLIRNIVAAFGIPCTCAGSTTFRKGGPGPKRGHGKEPDTSFYFNNLALIASKQTIDLETDPPPDLWIEVDNRASSRGRLPVYAALGIPEVWRYRVGTGRLWFGRLENEAYTEIDRSTVLPMLTPPLVQFALAQCGADQTAWDLWLRAWAAGGLATDA
ncbi:MAG: Uma2 family endonuclease [Isosphaeraceae bacterium]